MMDKDHITSHHIISYHIIWICYGAPSIAQGRCTK